MILAINNWSQEPAQSSGGNLVPPEFTYCSDNNTDWMSIASLQAGIEENREHTDKI